MREYNLHTLALLLLLGSLTGPALAQSKGKVQKKVAPPPAPEAARELPKTIQVFQVGPFDEAKAIEGLPPLFQGIGIKQLFDSLEEHQRASRKDEYETSDQFKARIEALRSKPLVNGVHAEDLIALVLFEPSFKRAYDADRGVLTIKLEAVNPGISLEHNKAKLGRSQIVVKLDEEVMSRDAVFQNAYGAKWEGKDLNVLRRGMAVQGYFPLECPITMAPQDARMLKDVRLGVLVTGHAQGRDLITGAHHSKASMDSPTDFFTRTASLPFAPTAILVFNHETGRVLYHKPVVAPPLSKVGIELTSTSIGTIPRMSILAPEEFKRTPVNQTSGVIIDAFTSVTSLLPKVNITVSTTRRILNENAPWKTDAFWPNYQKALEKAKAVFQDLTHTMENIAGFPASTIKGKMQLSGMNYSIYIAAFTRPSLGRDRSEFVSVQVWVDSTIQKSEEEAMRIMHSLTSIP